MKFKLAVALSGVLPAALFAEGTSSIDLAPATTALDSIKTALTSWQSTAITTLTTIAGLFLVFWLVKFVIRIVKQFTSRAA